MSRARRTMSTCPRVIGSKEPGQTASLVVRPVGRSAMALTVAVAAGRSREAGGGVATRCPVRSGLLGAGEPQHRVAVAALVGRLQPGRPRRFRAAAGALDDDDGVRGEPGRKRGPDA